MNPAIVQLELWNLALELRLLGVVTFFIACSIYPLYIGSMVRRETTPPRSSWAIWFVLDVVILLSQLKRGNLDALMVAYTLGTFAVVVASIRYGARGWTRVDTACVIAVGISLALWAYLGPTAALACALIGVTVGIIPLFRMVLKGAYESRRAWALAFLGSTFSALDGQVLTGTWFATLQLATLSIVVYHWGWHRTPEPV